MGLIQYKVAILGSGSVAGPDGDAYTPITPKGVCRHMEIEECPAANYAGGAFAGEGLTYKLLSDNFATVFAHPPASAALTISDLVEEGNAGGRTIGHPAISQVGMVNYNPATKIVKIASATANATQVLVREYS